MLIWVFSDARFSGSLYRCLHHGWAELRDYRTSGATHGMTLMRMPLSVWGIFVATILGLFAFPALFVSAIMMSF